MLAARSRAIPTLRRQVPAHAVRRCLAVRVEAADKIKIVGINGSLRRESAHKGLLHAAARRLPADTSFDLADISTLPLYNDDLWQGLDNDSALPEAVRRFRKQVAEAEVVLFSSPEYNGSLTGPLKNAIDWGSKLPCVFAGKVACVMGAGGSSGTARSQAHLRSVTGYLSMTWAPFSMGAGDLLINRFSRGFTGIDPVTGEVVDKELEDRVAALLAYNVEWARKLKPLVDVPAAAPTNGKK